MKIAAVTASTAIVAGVFVMNRIPGDGPGEDRFRGGADCRL